jgi:hypothetical protein
MGDDVVVVHQAAAFRAEPEADEPETFGSHFDTLHVRGGRLGAGNGLHVSKFTCSDISGISHLTAPVRQITHRAVRGAGHRAGSSSSASVVTEAAYRPGRRNRMPREKSISGYSVSRIGL